MSRELSSDTKGPRMSSGGWKINGSEKTLAEQNSEQSEKSKPYEIRVYKRRWLIVALYIFYTVASTGQWIQYSIIARTMSRYYDVSVIAIDWTSITFMFYYIPFIIPATYLMDRGGLRWTAICGSVISCIGSWIKVFSTSRDRFWLTFLGQSLVASTQVFILNTPAHLAGYWFASHEVGTASALCLFGTQMGVAVGFITSPLLVEDHADFELIGKDLSKLFRIIAVVATVAAVLIILFFRDKPSSPPSQSRMIQKQMKGENKEPLIEPIKRLLRNKSYVTLCNSYGIGVGVLNVIATLLSQMVMLRFEDGEKLAGKIGLALTVMGMLGSALFGLIIDKTHKFKETAVAVYFFVLCGQISFAVAMFVEIEWMLYVTGMFLGFFLGGYLSLGYQLCTEYTFPEAEHIATGILNIMNNIYGVIFVLGLGKVIELYGDIQAQIILCVALFVGLIATILTKDEQRRQQVSLDESTRKAASPMLPA